MFAPKKQGRPLLVGRDVESQVQEFIRESRASTCVNNTAVVVGAAKGIVMLKDANENGGYLDLSKKCAQGLIPRMGLGEQKREHCNQSYC